MFRLIRVEKANRNKHTQLYIIKVLLSVNYKLGVIILRPIAFFGQMCPKHCHLVVYSYVIRKMRSNATYLLSK